MTVELIPEWILWAIGIVATIIMLLYFDLLPIPNKPFRYKSRGRHPRIDLADAKDLPISRGVYDRNRKISLLKSSKVRHPIYVPDDLLPKPSNFTALLTGDTKQMDIRLPMDVAGRYVPWTEGNYPDIEKSSKLSDLERQNFMLKKRIERYSAPAEEHIDKEFEWIDRMTDMVAKLAPARDEQTRRRS